MRTFILDIIPSIQKFSKKLDDITLLTNQHWVVMDSIGNNKTMYLFRTDNELLVSVNGSVTKGRWEYLGNNSILIDIYDKSYLYKQGFFDTNVLALKTDNKNDFSVLINEDLYQGELNSIDGLNQYLENKYLVPNQSKEEIKIDTEGDLFKADINKRFFYVFFILGLVMLVIIIAS